MGSPAPLEQRINKRLTEGITITDIIKLGSEVIEDPDKFEILKTQQSTVEALRVCLESGVPEVLLDTLTTSKRPLSLKGI